MQQIPSVKQQTEDLKKRRRSSIDALSSISRMLQMGPDPYSDKSGVLLKEQPVHVVYDEITLESRYKIP